MNKKNSFMVIVSAAVLGAFSTLPSVDAAASEVISRGDPQENNVALTFDDRADGMNTSSILQTLADHDISATFFITTYGDDDQIPYIQDIVDQGHQIANHSLTHPYFTDLTENEMRTELEDNDAFIENASGVSTKPYFRPPYGDYNSDVLRVLGEEGYTQTIMWSVDTLDWTGNTSDEIVQRVMNGISPGGIVLMHTGSHASGTTAALPEIITNLDAMGYDFVTIEEMIDPADTGMETYTIQPGDSLTSIASQYDTTVEIIASENDLTDINYIVSGQQLMIPVTDSNGEEETPSEPETYTVQAGDTLWAIANEHGTSVDTIVSENDISDPSMISVGQTLILEEQGSTDVSPPEEPETSTYTVEAGDSLWAIANEHNTSVDQIASDNDIANPNLISVGQELTIQ